MDGVRVDGTSPGTVNKLKLNIEQAVADDQTAVTMASPARSRLGSQDDLESPHLGPLKEALAKLDARKIDDLAKKGLCSADTIIDSRKFRNPIHYLVDCYVNACDAGNITNIKENFSECLSVLTCSGVDINETDIGRNTPLHLLCYQCGVDDIIKIFIASGSRINAANTNLQTPLHLATDCGTAKDVEVLLEGGADPNRLNCLGLGPLHNAVKYRRNRDTIKFLIGCGAIVDLQGMEGNRITGPAPLHIAVRENRRENVRLLLELGAKTEVMNSSAQTPLHLAAKYDITGEIVETLLRGNAYINCRDGVFGETPLHKAVKGNMFENISVLVRAGASLAKPDADGDTPLHTAAVYCRKDIGIWVTLMNGYKADPYTLNSIGMSVLDKASRSSNKLGVNVIKQVQG